jgi:hypothetical protein
MRMKTTKCVTVLAVSATLILTLWAVVRAADKTAGSAPQVKYVEKQADTLRGIQSIFVLVDKPNMVIEQLGLTHEDLRKDAELQLRQYGIKLLTSDEWLKTPTAPDLHISVSAMPLDEDALPLMAVSIEVRLDQQVWLVRDPTVQCSAATWHANVAWRVPRARLSTVREVVKDQVSKFINDYLAVNPVKPPTPKP